ncbi:MAG: GDP-mannose 4,6-dehydratase [Candidatus Magnetomorum sp.]|nr:GDP-mannose 4,6-dehydratase [Candidatus Magnetomorum sp.]
MKTIDASIENFFKGKKILIAGGLGFIGSNLAHQCVKMGAEITLYDCMDPHSGGNLFNVKHIKNDLNVYFMDILNFDQLATHIPDKDIIINCAASTSHPFSMREPWIDLDVNSRGVINILEAIRRFNPKVKMVHLGTSTQLGHLRYTPADENHPEFPTDIYSANKSVSEKYVLIYSNAFGLRTSVIRLSNVFGPRASVHSPEFTFNNFFIGLALQKKAITVFGDGLQMRNVIYIDDAVAAILKAVASDKTDGQTFFATGDEHFSVADIATITAEILGGSVDFVQWPKERKAVEIGDAIITNQKAKSILNWSPKWNLRDGLVETRNYFSDCLHEYLR